MPESITHDNATAGQFYPAADRDGECFLCCPACSEEMRIKFWEDGACLDDLRELAEQHLKEVRANPLTS